jgi:hypothetical protein
MNRLPPFTKEMPFEEGVREIDDFHSFPMVVSQLLFESLRGVTDLAGRHDLMFHVWYGPSRRLTNSYLDVSSKQRTMRLACLAILLPEYP